MKLTFLGAAGNVTGSRFLLNHNGKNILIDCGLFQERSLQSRNWDNFPFDPEKIDAVLLTHAHVDHCGYLPKLVQCGFKGPIYCTEATAEIAKISLLDTASLQETDAAYKKRRHKKEKRKGPHPEIPLFRTADAEATFKLFKTIEFEELLRLDQEFTACFYPAGHILGAAMISIEYAHEKEKRRIVFSGDLGRWQRPIIANPHVFEHADYVVMEATYGDRLHEKEDDALNKLMDIMKQTKARGGNVVVPTFAIERAQEILYYLNHFSNDNRLKGFSVFLDSPMAIKVTKVFHNFTALYNKQAKEVLKFDDAIFHFPELTMTRTSEESKEINKHKGSSVILAGAGMCNGGRIKHHLIQNIENERNTILFIGYQAFGTLGRQILEQPEWVRIFGLDRKVKAAIEKINGFSAHADQEELLKWFGGFKEKPRKVFIVHSEEKAAATFRGCLRDKYQAETCIPAYKESFELT